MSSVEVVIPTFNGQSTLGRAVRSALSLPVVRRVIIVDDGSDPPASTGLGQLTDDPRVRLIVKPNGGTASARNRGLDESSADLVILLDTDDALRPEVLSAVALARRTGAPLTIGGRVSWRPDGRAIRRPPPDDWLREGDDRPGRWGYVPEPGEVFRQRPILMFAGSGLIVSRRVIDAGLRFDPTIRHTEDRDFCRRAADFGRIAVCAELIVDYYERDDGSNQSGFKQIHGITSDFLIMIDKHFDSKFLSHWRQAAAYRALCFSKFGTDAALWRKLLRTMATRHLPVPFKARLRWALRRATGRTHARSQA